MSHLVAPKAKVKLGPTRSFGRDALRVLARSFGRDALVRRVLARNEYIVIQRWFKQRPRRSRRIDASDDLPAVPNGFPWNARIG